MARPLELTILESREELEHRLDRQTTATGKERLQMLYWLKLGIVKSRQDLVKLLHKSEATITRWLGMYKSGGLTALLEVKHAPGNPNSIPAEAVSRLKERLKQSACDSAVMGKCNSGWSRSAVLLLLIIQFINWFVTGYKLN